jgi:FKBP-type peptidyl-prolyl cis-trans isomerase
MCVGETREAVIPPELAFDDRSKRFPQKPVPAGSTVTYEVRHRWGGWGV